MNEYLNSHELTAFDISKINWVETDLYGTHWYPLISLKLANILKFLTPVCLLGFVFNRFRLVLHTES